MAGALALPVAVHPVPLAVIPVPATGDPDEAATLGAPLLGTRGRRRFTRTVVAVAISVVPVVAISVAVVVVIAVTIATIVATVVSLLGLCRGRAHGPDERCGRQASRQQQSIEI